MKTLLAERVTAVEELVYTVVGPQRYSPKCNTGETNTGCPI